ncbi:hypothetical protein BGZ94_009324 [Podila epigama]|nr:hypothetical protein BGZ94_009324 [Podila epigama]
MHYPFIPSIRKPVFIGACLLAPLGFLQYYLYTFDSSSTRIPRFSAVEASLESLRPLTVPVTIVTAASGNHACALEAFLYHLNSVLNLLDTSPIEDEIMRLQREQLGRQYIETSPDMAVILKKPKKKKTKKKKVAAAAAQLQHMAKTTRSPLRQDLHPRGDFEKKGINATRSVSFEIRPRVVVYNMGMGPTKRKRRAFKALIEAGYMDEVYDFEFEKYPAFWALGTETRGEYGWKAGIIEEVSQRLLAQQQESISSFNKWDVNIERTTSSHLLRPNLDTHENKDSSRISQQLDVQTRQALEEKQKAVSPKSASKSIPPHHEPGIVLWLDSGDRISIEFLRWLPSFMRTHGLWTPQSQDTMWTWTHPKMLEYFNDSLDNFAADETNCNGAAIAFDVRNTTVRQGIMREWVDCARTKECIAPEGSSRDNHRQDQAALTYLVKTRGYGNDLCHGFPEVFGVQVNQDSYCKEDIADNPNRVIAETITPK